MSVEITDTAAAIARVRSWEHLLPAEQRLFEDPYAQLFDGGEPADEAVRLLMSAPLFAEHVRLRTRFIDDAVRAALAAAIGQIVILGVGFDCRALRLPEIGALPARVFEVDFAAQLARKVALLAAAGISIPPFVHLVPADFTVEFEAGLTADLVAAGFDGMAPVVVIWEGVVAYLDEAAFDRTIRWIAGMGTAGSRLVFNYPVSRFDPEDLAPRVRAAGFEWIDDASLGDVYGRYLAEEPPERSDLYRFAVAWR